MADDIILVESKSQKEISNLKEQISKLILKRDQILFVECENIKMKYNLCFGSLEYKLFKLQCDVQKQKRKIEMIRTFLNRDEKPNFDLIENKLDEEFKNYKNVLNNILDNINDALDRNNSESLSDEEIKELKSQYRKIVKKLHPDLNSDITDRELKLFQKAVEAYKNADLDTINYIAELVDDIDIKDEKNNVLDEAIRLKNIINKLNEKIETIKCEYPYNLNEFIKDEIVIENKKKELKKLINEYQDLLSYYLNKIKEMGEFDE